MPDQPSRNDSGTSGVRQFSARTKLLLNESERQYMYAILREYRTYKQLDALVLCLRSVLDTPVKMDLLKDIRRLVDHSQLSKYDELVPYHKMAHPWAKDSTPDLNSRRRLRSRERNLIQATDPQSPKTAAKGTAVVLRKRTTSRSSSLPKVSSRKMVRLFRDPRSPLDFEISGGSEEGRGIFVSRVKNRSAPDRAGLGEGDQILEVNGVTFDAISFMSAVDILTKAPKLTMLVRTAGKQEARRSDSEKILWYDVEERLLVADAFIEHDFLKLFRANSRVYRKVSIHVQRGRRYLGFNIRGGSEYDLGIYVSRVDAGGLGEQRGIRVGDRIMVVNGVSFNNVRHSDAVKLLRSQKRLFLILLFVGFYPVCKEVLDEQSEMDAVSILSKDEKALTETRTRVIRRKKPGSRFMEDTRLDHIWKSLSDGELWAEAEEDDEISIGSLPLHRWKREERMGEAIAVRRAVKSNRPRPHSVAGGRGSVNVFMVSREMASVTPVFFDDRRGRRREGSSSLEELESDGVLFREEKHRKVQRTMKKSRSLRDLSRSERRRSDVEQVFSSDDELDDEQHVALASLEIAAQRLDLLNEDEVQAVVRRTKQYFIDGDFESYIEPLMAILDTQARHKLLTEIRPLVRRPHLSTFDQWTRPAARPRGHKDWPRDVEPDEHFTHERISPRSKTSQRSEVSHHDSHKRPVTVPSSSSSFAQHGFEMPSPRSTRESERNERRKSSSSEAGRRSKDPKRNSRIVERSSVTPNVPSFSLSNRVALHRGRGPSGNRHGAGTLSSPETDEGINPPDYFLDNKVVRDSRGLSSDVDDPEWIHSIGGRRRSEIGNPWSLGREGDRRGGEGHSRVIDHRDSDRGDHRGRRSAADSRDKGQKDFERRKSDVDLHNRSSSNPRSKVSSPSSPRSRVNLRNEDHGDHSRPQSKVRRDHEDFSSPRSRVSLSNEDHEDYSSPRSRVNQRNEDHGDYSSPRSKATLRNEDHGDYSRPQSKVRKDPEDFSSPRSKVNLHGEDHEDFSTRSKVDHEDFVGSRSRIDLHRDEEDYGGLIRLQSKSKEDLTRRQSGKRNGTQELRSLGDKENERNSDGGEQRNRLNKEIERLRRYGSVDVGLPTERGHKGGDSGHEVRSKANQTDNWGDAEVHYAEISHPGGNHWPGSTQTRGEVGAHDLRGVSNSNIQQQQFWNWNGEKIPGDSAHENHNAAYRTDSVPSVNSALQLLDRVLRSEDASVSDIRPSRQRQPLTLPTNSTVSNRSTSPNSEVASSDSNLTSRRGSYDVTVPSLRSSLSQSNRKHARSLSKSSSSRFVDSGVASDFRSSTPVLAGFSLHRDLQFHDENNSAVSLTSIRHIGDEYPSNLSPPGNFPDWSQPSLRYTRERESRSNLPLNLISHHSQGTNQTVFSSSAMPLTFNVQKQGGDRERRKSSLGRVEPITVFLDKSLENLGLSISGGSDSRTQPDIMIESVISGGAADQEGTLKPGMQILSIDDVSLKSVSHQEAIKIIRVAFKERSMPVMRIRVLP